MNLQDYKFTKIIGIIIINNWDCMLLYKEKIASGRGKTMTAYWQHLHKLTAERTYNEVFFVR